jgi:hypothetical protein
MHHHHRRSFTHAAGASPAARIVIKKKSLASKAGQRVIRQTECKGLTETSGENSVAKSA